jgi:hypothetical protein
MSVNLHEVMNAAHERVSALAAEVAGYLILGAADQIAGAPRKVGWDDVSLLEDGAVRIVGGAPADDASAESVLREMLGYMLREASSVTPSLLRAGHRSAGAGVDALIRELEAALIPVNRAAARRALSRLHRDVVRARERHALGAPCPALSGAPLRRSEPPPPALEHAPREERPSVADLQESVELPRILVEADAPMVSDAERSWLTPDTVAVMDVSWPAEPEPVTEALAAPRARAELRPADELETVIPVYVGEEDEREKQPEVQPAPLELAGSIPEVPDLVVPPSPPAPAARSRPVREEPATVPQPPVLRARAERAPARDDAPKTPTLGSRVEVLESPEWPPMEISEPVPAALELGGDDCTERMPEIVEDLPLDPSACAPAAQDTAIEQVGLDENEAIEIERALADVALAFGDVSAPNPDDALATLDPPECGDEPEHVSPVPEILAESRALSEPPPSPTEATASEPQPELSAKVEPIAAAELEKLPPRPALVHYALPRYAPKKSSIDDLLADFSVAGARSERELCGDLKALAGVEATAPPPMVALSETPPPVAVTTDDAGSDPVPESAPRDKLGARVAAGAATALCLLVALGLSARTSGRASAFTASASVTERVGLVREEAPCAAELTVRQVPERARARLRVGPEGELRSPSRLTGGDAVFEGLACREGVEVTVEMPGHRRWVKIPVSAESLAPSSEEPSLVRYTVAVR